MIQLAVFMCLLIRRRRCTARIQFSVKEKNGMPLRDTSIFLMNTSNHFTYCGKTCISGCLCFYPICYGTYYLILSKDGYYHIVQYIVVCRPCLCFAYCLSSKPSCIYGTITNQNNERIRHADVVLYEKKAFHLFPLLHTTTDSRGFYDFVDISPGEYVVKAIK